MNFDFFFTLRLHLMSNFYTTVTIVSQKYIYGNKLQVDQSRHSVERPFFHHYWHDCHLWMDQSMVKSNANQLEQLKFVEFTGFTHKRDQLLLLDLLLTTAVSLESMIITSPRNLLWRAVKIPTSQPKHVCSVNPKAASNSFEMDYFWGFTRADSSGRCVANARPL